MQANRVKFLKCEKIHLIEKKPQIDVDNLLTLCIIHGKKKKGGLISCCFNSIIRILNHSGMIQY